MKSLDGYCQSQSQIVLPCVLEQFTAGLKDAGHTNEVVDLYAIRFDPVFRTPDFASYVHESMPLDILEQMNLKQRVLDSAGGPLRRFVASRWLRNKDLSGGGEIHPRPPAQRRGGPMGESERKPRAWPSSRRCSG